MKTNPFNIKTGRGVWFVVAVMAACFIAEGFNPERAIDLFGLWPLSSAHSQPWYQVVTYAFFHANYAHIGINLFMLWMFGRGIEAAWGASGLFVLLVGGAVGAAIAHLCFVPTGWAPESPVIGVSGGNAALLGAFAWLYPRAGVMLLFPPIPMRAWMGIGALFAGEVFFMVSGVWPGIAHDVHVSAFVIGLCAAIAHQYLSHSAWHTETRS